jgi:hypothetical protein
MQATWVTDQLTPLTWEQDVASMRWALTNALGSPPSDTCLALAQAKCGFETARLRSCHRNNRGNVKAGPKYVGMYCTFELNEVLRENGKDVTVWFSPLGRISGRGGKVIADPWEDPPGHPQTRMRAYANEFDGADAYIQFMLTPNFRPAFECMKAGDVAGMIRAMKAARYFTADETTYARGVASMHREYLGKLRGQRVTVFDPGDDWFEQIRLIISPVWKVGDDALESFILYEMERNLNAGGVGGQNLLDYERDDGPKSDPEPQA